MFQVQKESLADKAGLQIGDMVTEFSGRTTKMMPFQEARNIVESASLEIYMLLQRFFFFFFNQTLSMVEKCKIIDSVMTIILIIPVT